jgi:hypothetical protein
MTHLVQLTDSNRPPILRLLLFPGQQPPAQRKHPFIQTCALLAAIFIPAFVLIELWYEKPFVNLRLIGTRNLGIASAANFILGFALYGSVYLLPQYLTIVQSYRP